MNISSLEKKEQALSKKILKYKEHIRTLKNTLNDTKVSLRKETTTQKKLGSKKKIAVKQKGGGVFNLFPRRTGRNPQQELTAAAEPSVANFGVSAARRAPQVPPRRTAIANTMQKPPPVPPRRTAIANTMQKPPPYVPPNYPYNNPKERVLPHARRAAGILRRRTAPVRLHATSLNPPEKKTTRNIGTYTMQEDKKEVKDIGTDSMQQPKTEKRDIGTDYAPLPSAILRAHMANGRKRFQNMIPFLQQNKPLPPLPPTPQLPLPSLPPSPLLL